MNWLKRTLGILVLAVSLLFGGITNARAETLEVVFKSSLWGSAIGGVSGVALWALQDEDKEDKLFLNTLSKDWHWACLWEWASECLILNQEEIFS